MSVKVMSAVWDADLDRDLKAVLLAYADHANDEGGSIYPSIGYIAWKTGYSERHVQRITKRLIEMGILREVGRSHVATRMLIIELEKLPPRPKYQANPPGRPEKRGDTMSPDFEKRGDILSKPGDILSKPGDILSKPGDILYKRGDTMSPEPSVLTISSKPSKETAVEAGDGGVFLSLKEKLRVLLIKHDGEVNEESLDRAISLWAEESKRRGWNFNNIDAVMERYERERLADPAVYRRATKEELGVMEEW